MKTKNKSNGNTKSKTLPLREERHNALPPRTHRFQGPHSCASPVLDTAVVVIDGMTTL